MSFLSNFDPAGIESAVYISLFSDKRAPDGTELPDLSDDPRGFWADNNAGSHLWLLDRAKMINDTLNDAKSYCYAALDWMVNDGVVAKIDVRVYASDIKPDIMVIEIDLYMPDMSKTTHRFYYNWKLCVPEAFNGLD